MKHEELLLASEEKKEAVDYRQYVKERFEITDKDAEKIESFEAKNLPGHYKGQ